MPLTLKRLVRRHGAFVSAVTAVAVGFAIVLQSLLTDFVGWTSVLPYPQGSNPFPVGVALAGATLTAIPFAVGMFISLWLVAPIAEELRIGHVITRAILAAGIGATVVFILLAIFAITGAFSGAGALFSNTFPAIEFDGGHAVVSLATALSRALLLFVELLPLASLAGVLLWLWRKDHLPRHPLSGIIDEV